MRFTAMLAAALVAICVTAHAQDLPGGVRLGMTTERLHEAVPALQHVRHPAHLAGGLVGAWSGPGLRVSGVALTPTFFFADAQVKRVQYEASGKDSFDALLAWGRATWGNALTSEGPEGAYANWSDETLDAYLQRTSDGRVRLVVKQHEGKDATEL